MTDSLRETVEAVDGRQCMIGATCQQPDRSPCVCEQFCAFDFDDIERPQPSPEKVMCQRCGKLVKQSGLHDHTRAKHPAMLAPPEKPE